MNAAVQARIEKLNEEKQHAKAKVCVHVIFSGRISHPKLALFAQIVCGNWKIYISIKIVFGHWKIYISIQIVCGGWQYIHDTFLCVTALSCVQTSMHVCEFTYTDTCTHICSYAYTYTSKGSKYQRTRMVK